jgi:hypothetical protein
MSGDGGFDLAAKQSSERVDCTPMARRNQCDRLARPIHRDVPRDSEKRNSGRGPNSTALDESDWLYASGTTVELKPGAVAAEDPHGQSERN